MIKEFKCYTLLCDNCGADINEDDDNGISGWDTVECNYDIAAEGDWVEYEDKWYCPKCYDYDDSDGLIIKYKHNTEAENGN